MAFEETPDHFSWEEVYSLYSISFRDDPLLFEGVLPHGDDPSSLGEMGRGPSPLTNPIEAFAD
jgi:hypothetical protein